MKAALGNATSSVAALSLMSLEELAVALGGMSPEERTAALSGMSAEVRAAALSGMPAEERAAALAGVSPEQREAALSEMSPKERAAVLAAMPSPVRMWVLAVVRRTLHGFNGVHKPILILAMTILEYLVYVAVPAYGPYRIAPYLRVMLFICSSTRPSRTLI